MTKNVFDLFLPLKIRWFSWSTVNVEIFFKLIQSLGAVSHEKIISITHWKLARRQPTFLEPMKRGAI